MSPTFHPTDGPHDPFLIRLGRRDIGLINRPRRGAAATHGHPSCLSAAPACCAYAERGKIHWSCDSEAAIPAMDRHERRVSYRTTRPTVAKREAVGAGNG